MNPHLLFSFVIAFVGGFAMSAAGGMLWRYAISTERKTKKRLQEIQNMIAADDEQAHTYDVLAEMHQLEAQEQSYMQGRGGSANYAESMGCLAAALFVPGIVLLGFSLLLGISLLSSVQR